MKKFVNIPYKAFSINSMFCKNRAYKTAGYNEWSSQIFHRMNTEDNIKAFKDLREFFNPKKHGYKIDLKFYYPESLLYTKAGSLSARAHDLSNIEKPLIDLIFLPKYFNKSCPYGIENLNIDDKFICELSSKKLPSKEHKIEIEIVIVEI